MRTLEKLEVWQQSHSGELVDGKADSLAVQDSGGQVQTPGNEKAGSVPLADLIKALYDDPPPLKVQLIRHAVEALKKHFEDNNRRVVIHALLDEERNPPPVLNGVQPDIYVSEGSIDIAILVADTCPFPPDDKRHQLLEAWAAQAPARRRHLIDTPPEVKPGTPEALYKLASSTLEQEEKRFNDLEAKARNFFTSNSVVLGTGSLGIATTLNTMELGSSWKWWVGGPCLVAVVLGIAASLSFHVVQRTKSWDGRASPSGLLLNYLCYGVDHVYRAAAMQLRGSYESLSRANDKAERLLTKGIWLGFVSLIGFFVSLFILLLGYFQRA